MHCCDVDAQVSTMHRLEGSEAASHPCAAAGFGGRLGGAPDPLASEAAVGLSGGCQGRSPCSAAARAAASRLPLRHALGRRGRARADCSPAVETTTAPTACRGRSSSTRGCRCDRSADGLLPAVEAGLGGLRRGTMLPAGLRGVSNAVTAVGASGASPQELCRGVENGSASASAPATGTGGACTSRASRGGKKSTPSSPPSTVSASFLRASRVCCSVLPRMSVPTVGRRAARRTVSMAENREDMLRCLRDANLWQRELRGAVKEPDRYFSFC